MVENETKQHTRTPDLDKRIVSHIDNGIIVLDDELNIHHFNRWLELHTSLKEVNLIGKKIDELFNTINTKTLQRKIKTALRIKTPTFYTASTSNYLIPIEINQIKSSPFKYMQQDISIIPFDEEKNLVALIITDQTILTTTNSMLQTNIKKVEDLNTQLIKERDTIDKKILFIKFDFHGKITNISFAFLKLLEYEKEELLGSNFFHNSDTYLSEALKQEILNKMQKQEIFSFELQALTNNAKELWFKNSLVPEYDHNGTHIGFILFREDITDSKFAELNQERLLSSSRASAMGEMIAMIAHQWRQPLSVVSTTVATLKVKRELEILDDETIESSLETIESTVAYLSETIDDFREYFKPNKVVSETKLEELFNKSIFFLKNEMQSMNINYILNIDTCITIHTYKNELMQSLINIIKNSMDAFNSLQNNEIEKIISVDVQNNENTVSIKIEDNAGGIKPEVLKRVFEPYFSTRSKNGTGLGLYMCNTIITEHLKGEIIMSSRDLNTTTLIELPHKID